MVIDRTAKNYSVKCPTCNVERLVTYAQDWNIKRGKSTGKCSKCKTGLNTSGLAKGRGWNKGLVGFCAGHPPYFRARGADNPFYGKTHNPVTKSRMREKKIGKCGAEANNWRGGLVSANSRFESRDDYKQWRSSVFARDDYTCQMCGQRGGQLEADHILGWAYHPEVRYEVSNGRTLCKTCHKTTPNYGGRGLRRKNAQISI